MSRGFLARAGISVGAVVILSLATGPILSADAATGARGGFTSAKITREGGTTCIQGTWPCTNPAPDYLRVSTAGWAYNARTKPTQEVYVSILRIGDRPAAAEHGRASLASRSRPDIKKKYHLATARVGFVNRFNLGHNAVDGTKYTVCLHVRDSGVKESWRTVQCVTRTLA